MTPLTPTQKATLLELLLSTQLHGRLSEPIRLAVEKAQTLEDINYSLASSIQELKRANLFIVQLIESGKGAEAGPSVNHRQPHLLFCSPWE